MPFIQHTADDVHRMCAAIGIKSVDDLFAHIPDDIRFKGELDLEPGLTETEVGKKMGALAAKNRTALSGPCFLGGGSYLHNIPAMVDGLASRSEFVTAYTPYQPEASQGSLQVFFEYQSMICELTGMEVSNASMYDGASGAAEAAWMMKAAGGRKKNKLVISAGLDPFARRTINTYMENLGVQIVTAPLREDGTTNLEGLVDGTTFGVILGYPNFFGVVEDLAAAATLVHEQKSLLTAYSRPIPLGILASPGECGVDIVCGDGGGLGCTPWFGGPSFGFFASTEKLIRRMPGRIVGETVDKHGKRTFVLTFQPREQHIRREKATSNICTNHALMALRGTIHLAALGKNGLVEVGETCLDLAHLAQEKITALKGYTAHFSGPFFNEFVLTCPRPAREVVATARQSDIQAGIPLDRLFPEMKNQLLVAVTEFNTLGEIDALVQALGGGA